MDKIFSTRLDESVIVEMERATSRLGMTKKRFLEEAIQAHARQLTSKEDSDVWSETFGSWKRKEGATRTVAKARDVFRKTFDRHHG